MHQKECERERGREKCTQAFFDIRIWVRQVYGSFYCIYTSSNYYWEIIVISRRFLTALLVALVPYSNPVSLLPLPPPSPSLGKS
jgi:hypothetical protein